ncbi:DUF1203 domain-containing protein [Brevundimonas sp. Root1423]|uniref:DUF1203 domain-containing protein n=1 Tax=Brevundimonas sp. Root1423 TaxID=1736462 RepID=UPI0006F68380|nr:DUF1203 domain-containing protein [Brevundimonas sp. Root1423]KQY75268.1 hypothetical protein ASD25_11970 [Brevundimonas sp. Root1423]
MSFRILPLPLDAFRPLFAMDDAALESIGARRMIADALHSAPCRVSLADAEPGERLILLNHRHVDDPCSPFRSEGPIFVREAASEVAPAPGFVPDMLSRRLLSVRIYDADWMMIDADVVEGADLAPRLCDWFRGENVAVTHIHAARRGCYMAAAVRD